MERLLHRSVYVLFFILVLVFGFVGGIQTNKIWDIKFSTYYGAAKDDNNYAIAVDSAGNCYLGGQTRSSSFPLINPINDTKTGLSAYIGKFSPTGQLLWSTYLGGSGNDKITGIAIDSTNNVVVLGSTDSSDFVIKNAYQSTKDNTYSFFVTKFSSVGDLVWSTYLGGSGYDYPTAITVDSSDNILITGEAELSFPTVSAMNSTNNGYYDTVVAKMSSSGQLLWSTFLGGSDSDSGTGIATTSDGGVVVLGSTTSSNFPTKAAYDSTYSTGTADSFISKFSSDGHLEWSTYLGGTGSDYPRGIAVGPKDNIVVIGDTDSTDFPLKNEFQSSLKGVSDQYVSMFDSFGNLEWSTYLGGSDQERGGKVAFDYNGKIIVSGITESNNFPMSDVYTGPFRIAASIAVFSSTGSIERGFYYGSGLFESPQVAITPTNDIMLSGYSSSTMLPMVNAMNSTNNGLNDAFLVKFTSDPIVIPTTSISSTNSTTSNTTSTSSNTPSSTSTTTTPSQSSRQSRTYGSSYMVTMFLMISLVVVRNKSSGP